MSVSLPLKTMTIEEKLQAMELLWDDLSHTSEAIKTPDWHKDVLDERRKKIASGEAKFISLHELKEKHRK